MTRPPILLNPGPVTLTPRVRAALKREDWCHRESEFAALTRDVLTRLTRVYPEGSDDFIAVMLTGSGTAAVEAMLSTLVPPDSRTLVAVNGVYGDRMAAMLTANGREVVPVASAWEDPINLSGIEERLRRDDRIRHVVAVHHETTTGRLNDIPGLAALCTRYDRSLLLDAVSSFGAEEIRLDEWPVTAVAATANKCLHGVPGLSFVLARRDALESVHWNVPSVYLDLTRYADGQQRTGFSPFTQAVHVAFALQEALSEYEECGGRPGRLEQYRRIAGHVSWTLAELGVEPLLSEADSSAVLRAYHLPEGIGYEDLHSRLKKDGFVIYAGQGRLRSNVFRIAHMGDIRADDLDRLSTALANALGGTA